MGYFLLEAAVIDNGAEAEGVEKGANAISAPVANLKSFAIIIIPFSSRVLSCRGPAKHARNVT
jgi:hypothetical protein